MSAPRERGTTRLESTIGCSLTRGGVLTVAVATSYARLNGATRVAVAQDFAQGDAEHVRIYNIVCAS